MRTGGEPNTGPLTRTWEQIDRDFDAHLEKVRDFLRRPTVSASDDDMVAGAEFVAAMIEAAACHVAAAEIRSPKNLGETS